MHEFSVVQALMEQIEQLAKENNAHKVTQVALKIGTMSGIEPHLLEVAFHTFKEKSICDGSRLIMHLQPLVIECNACHAQSELSKPYYCCPKCESLNVAVIDGEDMFLMHLEME